MKARRGDPVVLREGPREAVAKWLRAIAIFLANRVVGGMPGHALRRAFYRAVLGWEIAPGATINTGLQLYGGRGRVFIGRNSTIQIGCLFAGVGMADLRIGDNVAIAYRTVIALGSHDVRSPGFEAVVAPVTIGDYVFLGSNVVVLPGVTIGEGAVVAAGSVIAKDVPPYAIVAGNPAQVVGERPRHLAYDTRTVWLLH